MYDFLFPPSGDVLRTAVGAGASISEEEEHCKFLCLFNSSVAFDSLRESFLLQLCERNQLETLQEAMFADGIVAQWTGSLDGEHQVALQRFATEHLDAYKECVVTTGPPGGFESWVWPCLVESMATEGYYLSIDELLVLSLIHI